MKTSFNRDENNLVEHIENQTLSPTVLRAAERELESFIKQLEIIGTIQAYTAWIKEWKVFQRMLGNAGKRANQRRNQTSGVDASAYQWNKMQIRPFARAAYEARAAGKSKARSGAFVDSIAPSIESNKQIMADWAARQLENA